ncbi:MAG: GAK system ATP-grasp enzyme [Gammaproteobacteria bacterium]|nr:GAK system ATP-grasp enzyme [Gammaproteobacteria bacterium]
MTTQSSPSPSIAIIGIPGKWSTETLADAVAARTGERVVVAMNELHLDLERGRLVTADLDLSQVDAIIVKKACQTYSANTINRLEMLRAVENMGVRLFNGSSAILSLINRLSCTVALRSHNIPMPPTVITESITTATAAIQEYGSAILKPLFSTKARGMVITDPGWSKEQLQDELAEFQKANQMLYIQKRIELPGQDLGLIFLGGEYIGTYARVGSGDSWNTTILSGGKYGAATPSAEVIEVARRAQAIFNLDYTTVDVAETRDGPMVFEVSAFGGFRGALEGLNIDIAPRYVDYVLNKMEKR